MKKFIMGLIVGIIIATTLTVGAASSINIFVNDKEINTEKAFISEGTTMVPLRVIAEALEFNVKWDEETRSIYITSADEPEPEETETRPKLTLQEVTSRFLPTVVTVETAESYGTGFFVSPDGKLITCAHVAKNYKNFIITMQDGRKLNASLLKKRDDWDLALLQVSGNNYSYIKNFGAVPNSMDTTFSFPRKYSAQVVQGEVGAIIEKPHSAPFVKIIHYNAPITAGSSGGPVINDQGELIGVTRQGSSKVAFAIAAEYVQKILE